MILKTVINNISKIRKSHKRKKSKLKAYLIIDSNQETELTKFSKDAKKILMEFKKEFGKELKIIDKLKSSKRYVFTFVKA